MANSGYYTEPKLNASGGGGSSLTIREADGTPSGVVTELVFPNTSVSIAGGVGTLSLVVAGDLATIATTGSFADLDDLPNSLNGYGITDAQPLDSDLTAIAALTTTSYGRSFLTQADAASGRTHLGVNTERIQVVLSANGQNISSGTKKGVIPILVAGTITAFRIDCDPANEPSAIAVQCDLNRIDRSTGTATTVLSSVASIATGANTGTGTIDGTQAVAVGDMLTIDIDQGSDGRELIASITITLS